MQDFILKVWVGQPSLRKLAAEAARAYPYESGGLLIGYWCSPRECVVEWVTGPGPRAKHYKTKYIPDAEFDAAEVASYYHSSDRTNVYLGDWHSHPGTTRPYLSAKDRQALFNVASSPEARAPRPLSFICAGEPGRWRIGGWAAEISRSLFGWPCLSTVAAHLQVFGEPPGDSAPSQP